MLLLSHGSVNTNTIISIYLTQNKLIGSKCCFFPRIPHPISSWRELLRAMSKGINHYANTHRRTHTHTEGSCNFSLSC